MSIPTEVKDALRGCSGVCNAAQLNQKLPFPWRVDVEYNGRYAFQVNLTTVVSGFRTPMVSAADIRQLRQKVLDMVE